MYQIIPNNGQKRTVTKTRKVDEVKLNQTFCGTPQYIATEVDCCGLPYPALTCKLRYYRRTTNSTPHCSTPSHQQLAIHQQLTIQE